MSSNISRMPEKDIDWPNHGPDPAEGAIEGDPVESTHEYYAKGGRRVGVWECSTGRLVEVEHLEDEFCTVLAGKVGIIDNESRTEDVYVAGTAFSCPKEAVSPGWCTSRLVSSI